MFYLITAHYTTGFEHKLSDNNYRHINAQIKQNWTSLTKKEGVCHSCPTNIQLNDISHWSTAGWTNKQPHPKLML